LPYFVHFAHSHSIRCCCIVGIVVIGPAILKSDREIRAGEWVQVTADRSFRDGVLIVNDGAEVRGKSPGSTRGLNLNTKLFVGGWDRQRVRLNPGVNVTSSFDGCLSQVRFVSANKF